MRRIDVCIDFPTPDAALRRRLWRRLIPPGVEPPDGAELDLIAERLPLAGGHIKTIVVDALHRVPPPAGSATEKPALTLRHLVDSAARTYEKLGRPVGIGEFSGEWLGWLREAESEA